MKKATMIFWHSYPSLRISPAEAQVKRKVVFGVPVTPPNLVHIPPYVAKENGFLW